MINSFDLKLAGLTRDQLTRILGYLYTTPEFLAAPLTLNIDTAYSWVNLQGKKTELRRATMSGTVHYAHNTHRR
jgi:hypothetical protein